MASVSLHAIRKDFGRTQVLKGIDLDIADQEFMVFVGPSGCGKSTLLRLIAGLDDPSSGEIRIGGRVVNAVAPKDRDIAMVFQNYALYPHMTVARNMGFGLRAARLPTAEIDRRVTAAATMLGLESLLQRRPGELSGGQRQRVAMGRAIVRDPKVFLFDEPLSNLDAMLRNQVRTDIKKLHQSVRRTSIYVTHDQVEAMTLADRIVLLRDGAIEQLGTPMELFARPANRFVAGFIGSPAMNFVSATLVGDTLVLPWLTVAALRLVDAPREVEVGIRPEDILCGEAVLTAPEAYRFEAVVSVVEPMGSEALLMIEAGAQTLQVRLPGRRHPVSGARLTFAFSPGELHVFDAGSGRSLR
jgi:multiple sugar transport system ATP-binding protein